MTGSGDSYIIIVHYPEAKEDMLEIRKRAGAAYIEFVKEYIAALPAGDGEKNKLYELVCEHLINHKTENDEDGSRNDGNESCHILKEK